MVLNVYIVFFFYMYVVQHYSRIQHLIYMYRSFKEKYKFDCWNRHNKTVIGLRIYKITLRFAYLVN